MPKKKKMATGNLIAQEKREKKKAKEKGATLLPEKE